MQPAELIQLLDELRALPVETEWLEFKEAKNDSDFGLLGICALRDKKCKT